jgi:hypothetical protein
LYPVPFLCRYRRRLFILLDIQNVCGACLNTYSTGYTFTGSGRIDGFYHNLEGARFNTFTAVDTGLFVDHVHALGVLGYRPGFAGFCALSALNAGKDFDHIVCAGNMNTGEILSLGIVVFIKPLSTGQFTGQTCHTGARIFNRYFFHNNRSSKKL